MTLVPFRSLEHVEDGICSRERKENEEWTVTRGIERHIELDNKQSPPILKVEKLNRCFIAN